MSRPDVLMSPDEALREYWGYDTFRPHQLEAVQAVLEGRDSLLVLPTGGGKSLCFQIPAVCLPGMAVVVSPLISLMKDQVDALESCGVAAACINSSLTTTQRKQVTQDIEEGKLKLLYVAPERLVQRPTIEFLKKVNVSLFAVDEAHCISEWGHDFRPEFRELRLLKQEFPHIGVHACTATATGQVRQDIVRELRLQEPEVIIGSFDRPNLVYRVARRTSRMQQIREIIDRHPGEPGIIYCISRAEVDRVAKALVESGYRAMSYHAGMTDKERHVSQDAFIEDEIEIIVATVAFGMGIDKPNVRYVIHGGMPKSLENYLQESGRAGRDGLEAECCLLFSGNDYRVWKGMHEERRPGNFDQIMHTLGKMFSFCSDVVCRHKVLVNYFGEEYPDEPCGACDVCLGELDLAPDPLIIGQKILSSVVRQKQRFGGDYTALVLKGSADQRIVKNGHDQLSTYGLLKDEDKRTIRDWIEQLVSQGFLVKAGEYQVLQVTDLGRELLRGEVKPLLLKPRAYKKGEERAKSRVTEISWEGVHRGLFDELKKLRSKMARERDVPAYIIFGDATLRDLARRRPSSLQEFRKVKGVGDKKAADYGSDFLELITVYCLENDLDQDAVVE